MIRIPLLGEMEKDQYYDELRSKPVVVNVLGGIQFESTLEEYEQDKAKEEFHEALENFLSIDSLVLKSAQDYVYQYYKDIFVRLEPGNDWYIEIDNPRAVWKHIEFCSLVVSRNPYGDKLVYISLQCSCDWEREHGLQIVFKQGQHVSKVGPFDGRLTNVHAGDNPENIIYRQV